MFQVGDRVISIDEFQHGVLKGEIGTVIESGKKVTSVFWDDYRAIRHDLEGRCPKGHGWHIYNSFLETVEPNDLGELPVSDLSMLL